MLVSAVVHVRSLMNRGLPLTALIGSNYHNLAAHNSKRKRKILLKKGMYKLGVLQTMVGTASGAVLASYLAKNVALAYSWILVRRYARRDSI